VLHKANVVVSVSMGTRPRVAPTDRLSITRLDENFAHATLHYGYMETPDIPADLLGDGRIGGLPGGTSFFIGRNSVGAARHGGMPFWQDIIFIFLQKNASDPTSFFQIPPNRVVELGTRIEI
nr:potassium transporter Kup [Sphingomonadaceae bacterium]